MPALLAIVLRSRFGVTPLSRGARWTLVAGVVALALLAAIAAGMYTKQPMWARSSVELAMSPSIRSALEQCSEAALLLHDVRWAASCMVQAQQDAVRHAACLSDGGATGGVAQQRDACDMRHPVGDGSAECELPGERAATLYAMLQRAEQRCLAEAGVVRR